MVICLCGEILDPAAFFDKQVADAAFDKLQSLTNRIQWNDGQRGEPAEEEGHRNAGKPCKAAVKQEGDGRLAAGAQGEIGGGGIGTEGHDGGRDTDEDGCQKLYLCGCFVNLREQAGECSHQSAKDGAGEHRNFWQIVMPNVKPAWLTLMIFSFQAVWNSANNTYIYKEQLKTLPTVMSQLAAGGVARVGVGAASSVILMLPPVLLFVFTQTNIIDTMATSGMKD